MALFFSRGFRLVVGALDLWLGLWTCSRGFGLVARIENSYGRRWPSATVFLMSLLVVALFCSRGFGLVVGALDLWLGLCLLLGALDL